MSEPHRISKPGEHPHNNPRMPGALPAFPIGTTVAYRRSFLRSIGAYTGAVPHARGRVVRLGPAGFPVVAWDFGEEHTVNPANLIEADRLHLEPR